MMAWPVLCEAKQIKTLLEAPYIQSMFHITKIEMGSADSQFIKVEGRDQNNKKMKATFKLEPIGSMGSGCPDYKVTKK